MGKETYKGSLKDFRLADLLIGFQGGTGTGILRIESGPKIKKVFIENGDIVYASSNDKGEQLGELLLKEGRLTLEEYNQLSDLTAKTGQSPEKVLVKLGYLTPKELSDSIKYQVEEIILNLFAIEDGKFEFHNGLLPEEAEINLRFSAANTIYNGIKKINNFEHLKQLCPPIDAVLNFSSDPLNIFQDITIEDTDKRILSYVNGLYTIKIILLFSPANDFETLKTICALLGIGLIKVKSEDEAPFELPEGIFGEPAENIRTQFQQKIEDMYKKCETLGYYEVLGIEKNASTEEIKKAYYEVSRQFHPDRHFSLPFRDKDIKMKLIRILSYTTESYEALSDPEKRKEYDKTHSLKDVAVTEQKPVSAEEKITAEKEIIEKEEVTETVAPEKPKRKRTWLYIPVIIIVAVVLVGTLIIYENIKKGPQRPIPVVKKERLPLPPFRDDLFDKLDRESSEQK